MSAYAHVTPPEVSMEADDADENLLIAVETEDVAVVAFLDGDAEPETAHAVLDDARAELLHSVGAGADVLGGDRHG